MGEAAASDLYSSGISSGINFGKYENIPVSVTGEKKPQPISSFNDAAFRPLLLENVTKSSYKVPTPVQKNAIPIIMNGRDLMACAQTGSGKTAAFLLPIIHKLMESDADSCAGASTQCPQCVVLTPTRELAIQIHNEARKFAQGSMIKSVVTYGGTSVNYQAVQLDMGFMPDIQRCVTSPNMPDKGTRQTLMFSATFPDDIQTAAQEFLNDYLFLTVGMVGGACSDVEQVFYEVAK